MDLDLKVTKNGTSIGVIFPKFYVQNLNLQLGDIVKVAILKVVKNQKNQEKKG